MALSSSWLPSLHLPSQTLQDALILSLSNRQERLGMERKGEEAAPWGLAAGSPKRSWGIPPRWAAPQAVTAEAGTQAGLGFHQHQTKPGAPTGLEKPYSFGWSPRGSLLCHRPKAPLRVTNSIRVHSWCGWCRGAREGPVPCTLPDVGQGQEEVYSRPEAVGPAQNCRAWTHSAVH